MISFIIPHWNHKELLYECLQSIYINNTYLPHEIVVVDNASTDGSAEFIKNAFPNIIWIQNNANLGYAKAINIGIRHSKGNFLFLLNNDVKIIDNAASILSLFLINTIDAGAVAPLLYSQEGRIRSSCRVFPTPSSLLLEFLGIERVGSFRKWKLNTEEHLNAGIVQQPMASALMVKRECWEAVGPMDEKFPIFFNDVDWCYRLYKNTNYKIYLCHEARVIHHEGASVNLLGYRKKIEFYKGLLRFYLKHFLVSKVLYNKRR